MAKQKDQCFVGRIDNVSYYLLKGIPCMRTIPAKVHQSQAVKDNSKTNGASTTMGRSFRNMLASALPFPRSFDMQTRFRGALRNWLKYSRQTSQPSDVLPFLNRFSFNEAARLEGILKVPLSLALPQTNELVLQIPSFIPKKAIAAPEDVTKIQMTIIAAWCDILTAMPAGQTETVLTIPHNNTIHPAQNISLPLQMLPDSLTLVVVSLQFFTNSSVNIHLTEERWLPSQVVGGLAMVRD